MFTLVGSTTFPANEYKVGGIASDGIHLYVITMNQAYSDAKVTKLRVDGLGRVDSLSFPGERGTGVATDGTYCYALVGTLGTRVAKIRTSDMIEVDSLVLDAYERGISIVNSGDHCLVLTEGGHPVFAQLIRIRTADMVRVQSLPVAEEVAAMAYDDLFCYIITTETPARVLKHNLVTMAFGGATTLISWEGPGLSVAVDDTYCYALVTTWGCWLVRIRKADMVRTGDLFIPASDPWAIMFGRGITGAGDYCYFIGHEGFLV